MPANPAVKQAAQKANTGLYAAPLNNLDDAARRARDVAARRQSDNKAYTAYIMGQQGKLAAAGMGADRNAAAQTAGIQALTLAGNAGLGRGLQAAREAQGIAGTVPSQQIAGLADDAARQNLILGAATQRSADRSQTNLGKAGFVQAAALAGMNAHSRSIAGDEFEQTSAIRREKTGLLADEANAKVQQRAAEEAARADIAKAEIAAAEHAADRASRENVAGAQLELRQRLQESDQAFKARQNRANRRVRLRTAATGAAAMGYVSPAEARRRSNSAAKLDSQREAAVATAKQYADLGGLKSPSDLRAAVTSKIKGAPPEVIDYALAAALGRKAKVTKKGRPSAARRYHTLLNRVKRGEIG